MRGRGRGLGRGTISPLLILLGILWASLAEAHAHIERSSPPDDALLAYPPREVRIWFTEPLETSFSQAVLLDEEGKEVEGTSLSAQGDSVLILSLPSLDPGRYTVQVKVLSKDGHVTGQSLHFTVRSSPPAGEAGGSSGSPVSPGVKEETGIPSSSGETSASGSPGVMQPGPPGGEKENATAGGGSSSRRLDLWIFLGAGVLGLAGVAVVVATRRSRS